MQKKKYEKPELKGEKLFEAGAATCCKTSGSGCTSSIRDTGGKNNINSTTS